MKFFVVIPAILAIAIAKPSGVLLPALRTEFLSASIAPLKSQFHAQDAFGQYRYGYSDALSAKEEIKTLDGITRGSYSYVDAEGKLQSVDYTADAVNGFRVAATNLPKALPNTEVKLPEQVVETVEVAKAKAAHLAAFEEVKTRATSTVPFVPAIPVIKLEDLPKQVEDTPEVAKAKVAHFAAKKEAELRNAIISEAQIVPNIKVLPAVNAELPLLKAAEVPIVKTVVPGLSAVAVSGYPAVRTVSALGTVIPAAAVKTTEIRADLPDFKTTEIRATIPTAINNVAEIRTIFPTLKAGDIHAIPAISQLGGFAYSVHSPIQWNAKLLPTSVFI